MASNSVKKIVVTGFIGCIMAGTLAMVGCQPQASTKSESSSTTKTAEAFTWSADSDCTTCHSSEDMSNASQSTIAIKHSSQKCTTCHTDTDGLSKAHAGLTVESTYSGSGLSSTTVDESACLTCHNKEDLATATANCTALTDKAGTVVNPHNMPVNTNKGYGSHESVTCSTCHSMHTATLSDADNAASQACGECHHKGTYTSCFSSGCHTTSS